MKALFQMLAILLGLGLYAAAQNQYPQDQNPPQYPQNQYPQNQYPQNQYPDNRAYPNQWNTRMSPDDQNKFNKEYEKWQESNAKHDQDDIDKHARNMENIMQRYNIPPDVSFASIATGNAGRYDVRQFQGRFSPDDQKRFDKAYEHWQESRRKHDGDDIRKDERKMQDLMARYNIPQDVPYDALASGGRGY